MTFSRRALFSRALTAFVLREMAIVFIGGLAAIDCHSLIARPMAPAKRDLGIAQALAALNSSSPLPTDRPSRPT